jgi:hypothetical protein
LSDKEFHLKVCVSLSSWEPEDTLFIDTKVSPEVNEEPTLDDTINDYQVATMLYIIGPTLIQMGLVST